MYGKAEQLGCQHLRLQIAEPADAAQLRGVQSKLKEQVSRSLRSLYEYYEVDPPPEPGVQEILSGRIEFAIPHSLSSMFLGFASEIDFLWTTNYVDAYDGAPSYGGFRLALDDLVLFSRVYVRDFFGLELACDESDAVQMFGPAMLKLGIVNVSNGDVIALDLDGSDDPPVIYLDHEQFEPHVRLGETFSGFFDSWSALGCPDPDSWSIKQFLSERGVDTDLPNSRAWLSFIND